VVPLDTFDMVLLEELLEAVLVSLEAEIHLIDVVSPIQEDQVLVLTDPPCTSELRPGFIDEFTDPA
jgi:hypothetical protein